jgi:hypothetical protein
MRSVRAAPSPFFQNVYRLPEEIPLRRETTAPFSSDRNMQERLYALQTTTQPVPSPKWSLLDRPQSTWLRYPAAPRSRLWSACPLRRHNLGSRAGSSPCMNTAMEIITYITDGLVRHADSSGARLIASPTKIMVMNTKVFGTRRARDPTIPRSVHCRSMPDGLPPRSRQRVKPSRPKATCAADCGFQCRCTLRGTQSPGGRTTNKPAGRHARTALASQHQ